MKWIKYQVVQCIVDDGPILLDKRVGYSEENLAIAQKEAYNGYQIVEDSKSFEKEPLPLEFGGTGAKSAADALKKFGINVAASVINFLNGVTSNIQEQLNNKAPASHGNHVPATQTADNKKFLRNDNTWQEVTPANIGAAASSHGTHVNFSTTNPVMDGSASVGSASTVARSDHKHPSDTSRVATANIANNLSTTASGYVLDARLGPTLAKALKAPQKVRYTATSNTSVGNCTGSSQSFTISGAPKGHYIVLGCGATSDGSWTVYDATLNSNTSPTKCTCKVNAWSDGGSFKMYVDVLYFGTLG